MARELYGRSAELIIGPRLVEGDTSVPPDGLRFRTRIDFSIKKNAESNPNTGRITVYNLSPSSRAFIQQFGEYKEKTKKDQSTASDSTTKNPGLVWLNTGYGDSSELLFFGDIQRHKVDRKGPDILLTVEAEDGHTAITRTRLVIGLAENSNSAQVFDAIAEAMNLTLRFPIDFPAKVYKAGYTFAGPARNALNDITKDQGLEWSVQNGELQIVEKTADTGQEAVLLTNDTGLIGSPTRTNLGVQAKSLLNTRIQPGNAVKITSEEFQDAVFKVTNVNHQGDSFEGDWTSDFEGVSVG